MSVFRRIAAAAAAAAALVMAVPAAEATPPYDEYAGSGAEVTEHLMRALSEEYSLDNPDYVWTSIDAGSTNQSIAALGSCPGITFTPTNPAPNGSGAGIIALVNSGNQCYDYARSTRPLFSGGPFTQYRLGGDSVSWAALPPSFGGHAPANLSLADLRKIYKCEVTDWSQLPGGTPGPILRYYNPTDTFTFTASVLGFDPNVPGAGSSCTTQPTNVAENHGTSIPAADQPNAILPYSKAAWTAQSNSALTGVPDRRGDVTLRTIDGTAPGVTGFVGNRSVYNIVRGYGATGGPGVHIPGEGSSPPPPEPLTDFLIWTASQNDIKALYGFTP